jgi:hypothetical protein
MPNVHVPSEGESYDRKDRFYTEQDWVFSQFSKYPTKMLLEDFNVRAGREDIFKLTTENEFT